MAFSCPFLGGGGASVGNMTVSLSNSRNQVRGMRCHLIGTRVNFSKGDIHNELRDIFSGDLD